MYGKGSQPMKLLLLLQAAHGIAKTSQGENQECCPFEQNRVKIPDSDGGVAQPIDLPGNGIQERGGAKPGGERLERIEHRTGKHKNEIKDTGDAVEEVVAPDAQGKDSVEEKPSGRADGHGRQEEGQLRPLDADAQNETADHKSESGLTDGDEDIENNFPEQVFAAAHGIGEHLVEDAVVAVEEERPGSIGGDGKTGHGQNSRQEEFVVIHIAEPGGSAKGGIDADTKDKHVEEREEKIPEDEGEVGGANFRFAIDNGGEGVHAGSFPSRVVNSTKISSRLAPRTSTRKTWRFRESALTTSMTRFSSILSVRSIAFASMVERMGESAAISAWMFSGRRSNAMVISYTPWESSFSVFRSPRAICFPLLMMRMSSQRSSASLRTCVVRMMVLPFSTSARRRFIT